MGPHVVPCGPHVASVCPPLGWKVLGCCQAALVCVAAVGLGHVDENAGAEERSRVHHPRRVPLVPLRNHWPQHERLLPREEKDLSIKGK